MPPVSPAFAAGDPKQLHAPVSAVSTNQSRISNVVYQRLVVDYVKDNKWTLLAFVVTMLFTLPVESVVLPRYYSRIFEYIRNKVHTRVSSASSNTSALWQGLSNVFKTDGVSRVFVTIVLVWCVVLVAYALKHTFNAHIMPSYTSFVRRQLFAGVIEKHSTNYSDIRVGEEITRIMDVSRNLKNLLCWVLSDLVPVYMTTLLLVGFLFWTSTAIGSVALVGVLVHTLLFGSIAKRSVELSATREHYFLQMSEKLHDSFGNLMNVYLNNMKSEEIESNTRSEAVHSELMNIQLTHTRNLITTLKVVSVVTFLVTIGVTYNEVRRGHISTTTFVSVWITILLYLTYMLNLSSETPLYITQLGIILCSNDFLSGILEASQVPSSSHTVSDGAVSFQDVTFFYPGNDRPTLHQFTFDVRTKEKVGLLGTSGSGKSTAMKLLSGMFPIQNGTVTIDGTDIRKYDKSHLRKQVNYINQRTQLFNTSIVENIQYGNNTSAKHIRKLLEEYELDTVYSKLHEGIDSRAGVNGSALSLGMQKVTMLLRGLLRGGAVVILDEPLAGLDAETRQKVLKLVKDTCSDCTLLVITHDKEIIPMMDRIVNLGELNHTDSYRLPPHKTLLNTLSDMHSDAAEHEHAELATPHQTTTTTTTATATATTEGFGTNEGRIHTSPIPFAGW